MVVDGIMSLLLPLILCVTKMSKLITNSENQTAIIGICEWYV